MTEPEISGGLFQPLSPRSVKTKGNVWADTRKSGRSPGPPKRFSGNAEPSPTKRATKVRAVCRAAGAALDMAVPWVASTSDGAAAPRPAPRGANSTRPYWLSHSRAASRVSRASPDWNHALLRAAAINGSCKSGVVAKRCLFSVAQANGRSRWGRTRERTARR